jgi:hypothetical protein
MCSDALDNEPDCVPLLLIRARAHIALRRDLDAQADLRDIIRLDPKCSLAFRLLGELAARRDENESAAIFFREALRLDPGDTEARDWLAIVDHQRFAQDASLRPAAVATKLPAPATAAGRFSSAAEIPRFARGTQPPNGQYDERPTKPFARGSERNAESWKTPAIQPRPATPLPLPPPPQTVERQPKPTLTGAPQPPPPAKPAPKIASRPIARGPMPELPGFGEYLVTAGILTRERLRAAQAYQRSMKVQLATAIVTLGLATPQRIEWAAVAHQSHLARERQAQ